MDFKQKTIQLFGVIYKDILDELMKMNNEAVEYLSFVSNIAIALEIYEEVLEELKRNMTADEIEKFLKFEEILSEAFAQKEKEENEQN